MLRFIDDYANTMDAIKRSGMFRFFDLPPELRSFIYRELLIFNERPPAGDGAIRRHEALYHPAILVTCRQASQEGKDILYKKNVFYIDCTAWDDGHLYYGKKVTVNGRKLVLERSQKWYDDSNWPTFLPHPRVLRIRFNINIDTVGTSAAGVFLNYTLCKWCD